jgi:hypothetical protein
MRRAAASCAVATGYQCARRARVFTALRAAAERPLAPFVRAALRAAAERSAGERLRAAAFACFASEAFEAAECPSCWSADSTARERRADTGFFAPSWPAAYACAALRRVFSDVVPFLGGFRSTPARRAFERPMAIACLAERAPCFPSRTCRISSRTNSPACVVGALPIRLSLRARSIVLCSGMSSTTSRFPLLSCVTVVAHRPKAQLSCNYRDGPTQVPRRTPAAAGSSIDLDNALRFAWGLLGLHSK